MSAEDSDFAMQALVQFGVDPNETDESGRAPIEYLLTKEKRHRLEGAFEILNKRVDFRVLGKPGSDKEESFFFKLMRSGQATINILNPIKKQLRILTIDEVENLLYDLYKANIELQPGVETFFKELRQSIYNKSRKKCKKPALMLHQKLVQS